MTWFEFVLYGLWFAQYSIHTRRSYINYLKRPRENSRNGIFGINGNAASHTFDAIGSILENKCQKVRSFILCFPFALTHSFTTHSISIVVCICRIAIHFDIICLWMPFAIRFCYCCRRLPLFVADLNLTSNNITHRQTDTRQNRMNAKNIYIFTNFSRNYSNAITLEMQCGELRQ